MLLRLHACSAPLELRIYMPSRRYALRSAPPELHRFMFPYLHACSAPLELYTSIPLHFHVCRPIGVPLEL